jgi:hypothetical protein
MFIMRCFQMRMWISNPSLLTILTFYKPNVVDFRNVIWKFTFQFEAFWWKRRRKSSLFCCIVTCCLPFRIKWKMWTCHFCRHPLPLVETQFSLWNGCCLLLGLGYFFLNLPEVGACGSHKYFLLSVKYANNTPELIFTLQSICCGCNW